MINFSIFLPLGSQRNSCVVKMSFKKALQPYIQQLTIYEWGILFLHQEPYENHLLAVTILFSFNVPADKSWLFLSFFLFMIPNKLKHIGKNQHCPWKYFLNPYRNLPSMYLAMAHQLYETQPSLKLRLICHLHLSINIANKMHFNNRYLYPYV